MESNARVVEWEDGSRLLFIGKDAFHVRSADTSANLEFLYARQSSQAEGMNEDCLEAFDALRTQMSLEAHDAEMAHRSILAVRKAQKRRRVGQMVSKANPELEKEMRIKAREDEDRRRVKASQKKEVAPRMTSNFLEAGASRKRRVMAVGGSHDDDDDDDDDDDSGDENEFNINKAKHNVQQSRLEPDDDSDDDSSVDKAQGEHEFGADDEDSGGGGGGGGISARRNKAAKADSDDGGELPSEEDEFEFSSDDDDNEDGGDDDDDDNDDGDGDGDGDAAAAPASAPAPAPAGAADAGPRGRRVMDDSDSDSA